MNTNKIENENDIHLDIHTLTKILKTLNIKRNMYHVYPLTIIILKEYFACNILMVVLRVE